MKKKDSEKETSRPNSMVGSINEETKTQEIEYEKVGGINVLGLNFFGSKRRRSSSASSLKSPKSSETALIVKRITLTEKVSIDSEKEARKKIVEEIACLNQELGGEMNVENFSETLEGLKVGSEEMMKTKVDKIKEIIESYLCKINDNYDDFFGVEKGTEKIKIALTLLHNYRLFSFAANHHTELNSSIVEVLAQIYQNPEQKILIDNGIEKLLKKLGEQPETDLKEHLEILALGKKIAELKTNCNEKEAEIKVKEQKIKDLDETLTAAGEEIIRYYGEVSELYERLAQVSASEKVLENLKKKIDDIKANEEEKREILEAEKENLNILLETKERNITSLEKEINRLQKSLERVEKESNVNQQEIAKKALEALNLFEGNQKKLRELQQELKFKEKELQQAQNDIAKFEAELAEKEKKIIQLEERNKKLKEKGGGIRKNQQATINFLEEELAKRKQEKEEVEKKRVNAERKKATAEEKLVEIKQENEKLSQAVEESLTSFMGQLTDLQKSSQKYQEILISLGLEEADFENFGGKSSDFFADYLGQKETDQTHLTFKDIRTGEGMKSLADLLVKIERLGQENTKLKEDLDKQTKKHQRISSLTPITVIDEPEASKKQVTQPKQLNPETPENIEELVNQATELKEKLSLIKSEEKESKVLHYQSGGFQTRDLLEDTINLLEQEGEKRKLGIKLALMITAEEEENLTSLQERLAPYFNKEYHDLVVAVCRYSSSKTLEKTEGFSKVPNPATPLPSRMGWSLNSQDIPSREKKKSELETWRAEKEDLVKKLNKKEKELVTKTEEINLKKETAEALEDQLQDYERKLGFKLAILINYSSLEFPLLELLEITSDYLTSKGNLAVAVKEKISEWKNVSASKQEEMRNAFLNQIQEKEQKNKNEIESKDREIVNLTSEKRRLETRISNLQDESESHRISSDLEIARVANLKKTNSRLKWTAGILGLAFMVSIVVIIRTKIKNQKADNNEPKVSN